MPGNFEKFPGEKPKVHKINVAESLELVLLAIESTSFGKN